MCPPFSVLHLNEANPSETNPVKTVLDRLRRLLG